MYDALKNANKNNKLYGFLGGPSGIIEGDYIEFDDKKIDEYNKLVNDQKKKIKLPKLNNRYSLINQKEFENNIERCASYVYSYLRKNDIIEV